LEEALVPEEKRSAGGEENHPQKEGNEKNWAVGLVGHLCINVSKTSRNKDEGRAGNLNLKRPCYNLTSQRDCIKKIQKLHVDKDGQLSSTDRGFSGGKTTVG